jgi:acetyl esterase/lipase
MDWNQAYDNIRAVGGVEDFMADQTARAEAFRNALGSRARLSIPYGDSDRTLLDIFMPEGKLVGLAIFVHGGYWQRLDRTIFSHLAAGALARGWAVAMPSYTLCPNIRISGITEQIGAAIRLVAGEVPGRLRLAGHSAGGHLVARMACEGAPLGGLAAHVEHFLSISGVHDLRPLLRTAMNDVLDLDEAEANVESPALLRPKSGARMTCWVGGAELPEFRRQNALLANIWHGLGAVTAAHEAEGKDHFTVIEDLTDPQSTLVETWLD